MLDARKFNVRSIDDLIVALHPVQNFTGSPHFETTLADLRQMKNNISAVLSFTACVSEDKTNAPEFSKVLDEMRRECLLINGMISRIIFRQRWLFSVSKAEEAHEVLAHYKDLASATCRMCRLVAPELGANLLSAF